MSLSRIILGAGWLLFGCCLSMASPIVCELKDVRLSDGKGKSYDFHQATSGQKARVFLFLMTDCPVANAMMPDLSQLVSLYSAKGIEFYGLFAEDTVASITKHQSDYKLPFPCLLDKECKVAKIAGVKRVPECAIFSPEGKLLYAGRIDDRATKSGRIKPAPSHRELADALKALTTHHPIPASIPATAGCYLPLK